MKFTPKTEKEIAESNLLAKGEYPYEVVEAEDTKSKSGNEMITLKLHVYAGESFRTLKDYLLEAIPGKLRNFCQQNGLMREYDNGTLKAADCIGKGDKVLIGIEKDKAGTYPDKNRVVDYVAKRGGTQAQPGKASTADDGIDDSDVPF